MGRSELPEEEKSSSSYEDVTDEEEEVRPPEAVRPRQPAAAESREPEPPSGRAPAFRTEKKATRPAEKEESSDDPRHRRHGRSSSRHREGRRTPSPAVRPRSPTVLPGAFPKSRPTVPDPPTPAHKGRGKGKKMERPRCRFCWKEMTPLESGQSQHEYWSSHCLSWQFKLAGYPYNQCEQLAEELKQRRMERFQELGPYPNAHVAFPGLDAGGGAPARAVRPELPAEFHEDTSFPVPEGEKKIKKEKKHKESRKEEKKDKRKEKKKDKTSKSAAAHDAAPAPEKKKKKTHKSGKGNKIHVISPSPSPETMRRRKRDPPSSSDSDGGEERLTLVSCGRGKFRLLRG